MQLEHINIPTIPTYNHLGQALNLEDHSPKFICVSCASTVQFGEVLDAQKTRDVIQSCQNLEHWEVAKTMTDNFLKKWGTTHYWTNLYQLVQEKYEDLELESMEENYD